jgi:pilus assembly protein CpaB
MSDQPRPERHWNLPVIVAGVVVAILGFAASVYLGTQGHAVGGATKQIVVAARDLDARTSLSAEDLKLATYSDGDAPPFAYSRTIDVVGKVALVSIRSGQPLLANQLGSAADAGAFLPLPKGYVAATVPTGELVGVAGYIKTGDYINVIAVVPSQKSGFANVRTIYSGIKVVRSGADSGGGVATPSQPATSLTLQVSECQAEFLGWFLANASLKYSLLSFNDYTTAAQAGPDTSCPANGSTGVTETDVKNRWPGLLA